MISNLCVWVCILIHVVLSLGFLSIIILKFYGILFMDSNHKISSILLLDILWSNFEMWLFNFSEAYHIKQ